MILVFGANGLLGSHLCAQYPKDTVAATREDVDITQTRRLKQFIYQVKPDVVINCAGIVKNHSVPMTYRYFTNSCAPQTMAKICDEIGVRMIQVSTDCVFNGAKGLMTEEDFPEPEDLYGSTKLNGEVVHKPHLTVRASFIGWPDPNRRGLAAWLMAQKGKQVSGFTHVKWNGMTADALASILVDLSYKKVTGLRHIFAEDTTKFEVLSILNKVYDLDCEIKPVNYPQKDMRLRTLYHDTPIRNYQGELYWQICQMRDRYDEAI